MITRKETGPKRGGRSPPYSLVYDTIGFTIPGGHLHFLTSTIMPGVGTSAATDLVIAGPGSYDTAIFSDLSAKLGLYHSKGHKLVAFHTVTSAGTHLTGEATQNVRTTFSHDGYLQLSTGSNAALTNTHFHPPVPSVGSVLTGLTSPQVQLNSPTLSGQTVTIAGRAQVVDAGAKLSSITWQWGDGTTTTSKGFPVSHTYSALGTYTVNVAAADSYGSSATNEVEVILQPPLISISSTTANGFTVTVSGSAMAQITGGRLSTLTFQWGDGTTGTSTGFPTSHTYTSPGTYQITVTATDDHGLSASTTTTATIYYNCGDRCPE